MVIPALFLGVIVMCVAMPQFITSYKDFFIIMKWNMREKSDKCVCEDFFTLIIHIGKIMQ